MRWWNRSKLGSHIDQVNRSDLLDDIIESRCRIAFVNADMGAVGTLARANRDMVIVTRHWRHPAGDDARRMGVLDDPQRSAREWWQHTEQEVATAREVAGGSLDNVYWQSVNEPVMTSEEEFTKLMQHELERMKILEDNGLKAGIFAFATGTPRMDAWEPLYPALARANQNGHLLLLHEYFAGLPWIWFGDNQDERVSMRAVEHWPPERAEGWLFGRYRKVWNEHVIPNGWEDLRVAITEIGSDMVGTSEAVQAYLGRTPGAWKGMIPAWNTLLGPIDAEQRYLELLAWCDGQMRYDPYVVGATVFTDGTGSTTWQGYDINPAMSRRMYDYIKSLACEEPILD
jgi:hypothetical protein